MFHCKDWKNIVRVYFDFEQGFLFNFQSLQLTSWNKIKFFKREVRNFNFPKVSQALKSFFLKHKKSSVSWNHRIIIRTGITCEKIPCYMRDLTFRWFIVKKLKYFEVMFNIFEFSRVWENVESWLVYADKFCWIVQSYFLIYIIKGS